jgi:hypothetical protein
MLLQPVTRVTVHWKAEAAGRARAPGQPDADYAW